MIKCVECVVKYKKVLPVLIKSSGVTESFFGGGGGGAKGRGTPSSGRGQEYGIAMIFSITFIVHIQGSNGGGGHGVNGGTCPPPHSYATDKG